MGLTQSINIASQALSTMQTAMSTVSNNVANVSTEGYHKLRANLAENINYTPMTRDASAIANSLSGVEVAGIQRYSNIYLQSYYWGEYSQNSYLKEYSSIATNMENLVNELDGTGLAKSLSNFYTAVDALNDSPSDLTARQNFVSAAENLCTTFNTVSSNLGSLQQSLIGTTATVVPSDMSDDINKVNSLLKDLANVNESILKTNSGDVTSSSLMDKRDALVTQLEDLIKVDVTQNPNNTVNVNLGNISLVSGTSCNAQLSATNSADLNGNVSPTISVKDMNGTTIAGNVNSSITGGSLGAIIDACGTANGELNFSNIKTFIDDLANQFASTLNAIQTGDPNTDGTTPLCISVDVSGNKTLTPADPTQNLFVSKVVTEPTITAGNISLNSTFKTNPYAVAAARLDIDGVPVATYQNAIGNNSNAALFAASRSKTNPGLDASTFENYLSSNVSIVGSQIEDISDQYTTQSTVLAGIETKLSAETGVNLDEELSDMLKYQQAYKAAARVFSTCNDLIDVLLQMGS